MYSLGIDIGYASIKLVLINNNNEIKHTVYLLHKGRIQEVLKETIYNLLSRYALEDVKFAAITGNGSKFLAEEQEIQHINEVTAIVEGSRITEEKIGSIIEIGGQSAKYITEFNKNHKSQIKIGINADCSAGTGSFLEEQISRLDLKLEDYSIFTEKAQSIPRIAGRCSVFAKTDLIHHQQEGVCVEDLLLGLAYALVKNYKAAVIKKLPIRKPILFIGGVAYNLGIIRALKDVLSLDEGELIVPQQCGNVGALGAAVIANKDKLKIDLQKLLDHLENRKDSHEAKDDKTQFPKLKAFGENDSENKHLCKTIGETDLECYLGIDIGSTSTNLVLMNKESEIIAYRYLKTLGNPIEAVRKGLKDLKYEFGDRIKMMGVGTTGSGRYMIGELIGADIIKDEITAQAKAAVTIDDSVDTIFEIGGQDSKYIRLENGVVTDFEMNKICAAGTGSFIEEQAKKLNIPVNDFGEIALNSHYPVNLGERCTVFIEANIAASLSKGVKIDQLASGLCYAIAKNYLNKVVGQKKIGNKIFFQGGVAYNQGVINAFRALLGDKLFVPPFFSVTGAYGVAILAKEEMLEEKSKFKGLNFDTKIQFDEKQKHYQPKTEGEGKIYNEIEKLYLKGYDASIDPQKETVGIPRVLFLHKLFPMFHVFFKELGFNVLLSNSTDEETIKLSQEYSLDETCYPVKLIHGHVAELMNKKVNYLFLPALYTMTHPISKSRQDYGCVYMQAAPAMINQAMELEKKGIKLLSPVLSFKFGKKYMMSTLLELGKSLGKSTIQTMLALQKGMQSLKIFEKKVEMIGQEAVKKLKPGEKAFVIITRAYGVSDPVLNMGIPKKLMAMGYKVLTLSNLPAHTHDTSKEYPNMYWPFGQHILSGAQIVKQHPNLYAIYITNHGCGPDTILAHYFREEMKGKPYLSIEVDEHSSSVGVLTRVEAFVNSLKTKEVEMRKAEDLKTYSNRVAHKEVNIKNSFHELKDKGVVYLPYLYPYSTLLKELLLKKGIKADVLPMTNSTSVDIGRKFTITKEYFSLTAILGDVFKKLYASKKDEENMAFFIPKSEGTEANGQYDRLLRMKLNEEGFHHVEIIAPFIEDVLHEDEDAEGIYLSLLAGDLIRMAPKGDRDKYLCEILAGIKNSNFKINHLKEIAKKIYTELKLKKSKKRIFVIGEPMVLFNDFMNNFTFNHIEEEENRVIYSPLSEYMWFIWGDFLTKKLDKKSPILRQRLNRFEYYIHAISECLADESPFAKDLSHLIAAADERMKYYSGGNGRYRQAKIVSSFNNIDGIITAASMYENTNIILNLLYKGVDEKLLKPVLHLTFDGNKNENDETKIKSFMYYI
ncbi:CoA-substrate-specific enzyme activase [Clostridium aceticum]|uniref:CoA-substrate-specific enzyme activase n=1 Tax=Clostridium aceticum TaxID=84022 RepID=A0A0D8IAA1_9CLOT|nr:acyl-CoA dehydratase activase [Clostridium aceticum]AKL96388.1 CoA-substrate-specific enzyme activase [Clostridium aceticum]KJF26964.1 CoA activase [Clostridium aceticum]